MLALALAALVAPISHGTIKCAGRNVLPTCFVPSAAGVATSISVRSVAPMRTGVRFGFKMAPTCVDAPPLVSSVWLFRSASSVAVRNPMPRSS